MVQRKAATPLLEVPESVFIKTVNILFFPQIPEYFMSFQK